MLQGIPGVSRGYSRLQAVRKDHRELQGVTGGYKWL